MPSPLRSCSVLPDLPFFLPEGAWSFLPFLMDYRKEPDNNDVQRDFSFGQEFDIIFIFILNAVLKGQSSEL